METTINTKKIMKKIFLLFSTILAIVSVQVVNAQVHFKKTAGGDDIEVITLEQTATMTSFLAYSSSSGATSYTLELQSEEDNGDVTITSPCLGTSCTGSYTAGQMVPVSIEFPDNDGAALKIYKVNFVDDTGMSYKLAVVHGGQNPYVVAAEDVTDASPYFDGDVIRLKLTFNEDIYVENPDNLALEFVDITTKAELVDYTNPDQTNVLYFEYTVAEGDTTSALQIAGFATNSLPGTPAIISVADNTREATSRSFNAINLPEATETNPVVVDGLLPTATVDSAPVSLLNSGHNLVTITWADNSDAGGYSAVYIVKDGTVPTSSTVAELEAAYNAGYLWINKAVVSSTTYNSSTGLYEAIVTIDVYNMEQGRDNPEDEAYSAYAVDVYGNISRNTTDADHAIEILDVLGPIPVITDYATWTPTNETEVEIKVDFGEEVENFGLPTAGYDVKVSDLGYVNDNITAVDAANGVYTFTIDLSNVVKDGDVILTLIDGAAWDEGTNGNPVTYHTIEFDNVGPTPTISGPTTTISEENYSTIPITVTFNEAIDSDELDVGDIILSGSGAASASVTGITRTSNDPYGIYTFGITGAGTGEIVIDIPAGVVNDYTFGNYNVVGDSYTIEYDAGQPAPTITVTSGGTSKPTNTTPIVVQVDFGEEVVGFATNDITLTTPSLDIDYITTPVEISTGVYEFKIYPEEDNQGPITITLGADKCTDLAGNYNLAATPVEIEFDDHDPEPVITLLSSNPTSNKEITIFVDFGEEVSGLTTSDIVVTNGYIASEADIVAQDDGSSAIAYKVTLIATSSPVSVYVLANAAVDEAGNASSESNVISGIVYDATSPTTQITSLDGLSDGDVTNITNDLSFMIDFGEALISPGYAEGDLVLSAVDGDVDVTIHAWTKVSDNPAVYTFKLDIGGGSYEEAITIEVMGGDCSDELYNGCDYDSFVFTYDESNPVLNLTPVLKHTSVTNDTPFDVIAEFSEEVSGFDANDVTVSAGFTVGSVTSVTSTEYTIHLVNTAPISSLTSITIEVGADECSDTAGNGNNADDITIAYDVTHPEPTITIVGIANGDVVTSADLPPYQVKVDFGEKVEEFTSGDINIAGSTVSTTDIATADNQLYTFYITNIATNGSIKIDIDADEASDYATNSNLASEPAPYFTINYDAIGPIPTIGIATAGVGETYDIGDRKGATDAYYSNQSYRVVIDFGETLATGIALEDVTVTPSYVINWLGDATGTGGVIDTKYVFDISGIPDGQENIIISVADGKSTGASDNNPTEDGTFTIYFDNSNPTPTIYSNEVAYGGHINTSPVKFFVDFGEAVVDFDDASDVTVTNALVSAPVSQSVQLYTFSVTPNANGDVTIDIDAMVASDYSYLPNQAGYFSFVYDLSDPVPTIISPVNSTIASAITYTYDNVIPVTIDFGEQVDNFDYFQLQITSDGSLISPSAIDSEPSDESGIWTFEITVPDTEDNFEIDIDILSGFVTDMLGNVSSAIADAPITIVYDGYVPTPVITTDLTNDPRSTNIDVTLSITFDYEVDDTEFTASDITVTPDWGGDVTLGAVSGSGTDYTVLLSVANSHSGVLAIDIAEGVTYSVSGMPNDAAAQYTFIFDNEAPLPTISGPMPNGATTNATTYGTTIEFTVDFGEQMSEFASDGVTVTGGSYNVAYMTEDLGNGIYTFAVELTDAAEYKLYIDAVGSIGTDFAGNIDGAGDVANTYDEIFTLTFDGSKPTPSIIITNPVTVVHGGSVAATAGTLEVNVVFSEEVSGWVGTNLTTNVGTLTYIGTTDDITFTYDFPVSTISGDQVINFHIAEGCVMDVNGNLNLMIDGVPDNTTPDEADYPSGIFSFSFDNTGPTPTIQQNFRSPLTNNYTNTDATDLWLEVDFGEAMSAFGDVSVSYIARDGSTNTSTFPLGSVTDDNFIYTFTFGSVANPFDATFSVICNAGTAADVAGNANYASSVFTFVWDTERPHPTIETDASVPVVDGKVYWTEIPVNITFQETVTGFTSDEIIVDFEDQVTGGSGQVTKSAFTDNGDDSYTITLTVSNTSSMEIEVFIDENVCEDLAGNLNSASGGDGTAFKYTILYESSGPEPTISLLSVHNDATIPYLCGANPMYFTADFGTPVTGLTTAGFTISGTTDNNAYDIGTNGNGVYTFYVIPVDGLIEVELNAGAAEDAYGNLSLQSVASYDVTSSIFSVLYDGTAPEATIELVCPSPVTEGVDYATANECATPTLGLTIDFQETVDFFGSDNVDISVTYNGLSDAGTINHIGGYTDLGNGLYGLRLVDGGGILAGDVEYPGATITIDVPANVATDEYANVNTPASFTVLFDNTAPQPTIMYFDGADWILSNGANIITGADPYPLKFKVDFGEPLYEDIETTDISATFSAGATGSYTVLGNNGTGIYTFEMEIDGSTASLDVELGTLNSTLTDLFGNTAVGGQLYNSEFTFTFDGAAPVPTIELKNNDGNWVTHSAGLGVNVSPVNVRVDFGEDVTLGDWGVFFDGTLAGTTTLGAASGSQIYTFLVTPTGDTGNVIIDIDGDMASDAAGNWNEVYGTDAPNAYLSFIYDASIPEPTISTWATDPTSTSPVPIVVDFGTDEVMDPATLEIADIIISSTPTGAVLTGNPVWTSDNLFTFNVAIPASLVDSEVKIVVEINNDLAGLSDIAGNASTDEFLPFTIVYDNLAPVPTVTLLGIDGTWGGPNYNHTVYVEVDFGTDVTGFYDATSDLSVTYCGATFTADGNVVTGGSVDDEGNGVYTFEINPSSAAGLYTQSAIDDGLLIISIPAGAVTATSNGKANVQSIDNCQIYLDDIDPEVVDPDPLIATEVGTTTFEYTISFDECMHGISTADITVSEPAYGFTITTLSEDDQNGEYTFKFETSLPASSISDFTIDIPANAATDCASNTNAAVSLDIDWVADPPEVTITLDPAVGPTNADPVVVTLEFFENGTTTPQDVTISEGLIYANFGSIVDFGGSGSVYTFNVINITNGTLEIVVDDDAGENSVGVGNERTTATILYDGSTATPVLAPIGFISDPTNVTSIPFRVDFGEELAAGSFTVADITVTLGTVNSITDEDGNNQIFSFYVEGLSGAINIDGDAVVVGIPDGAATDLSGNATVAVDYTFNFDDYSPTPVITITAADDPTGISPVPFSVEFGERMTSGEFTLADITITPDYSASTVLSGINEITGIYEYEITPDPAYNGTITIEIAADVTSDYAGNPNNAAVMQQIEFIGTGPIPTIMAVSPVTSDETFYTTETAIDFEVYFGRELTTLINQSDIIINNGFISGFQDVSDNNNDLGVCEFTVYGYSEGTITIDIPANSVTDVEFNKGNVAAQFSFVYDVTRPQVTSITFNKTSPTDASVIEVTIGFDDYVFAPSIANIFSVESTGNIVGATLVSTYDATTGDDIFVYDVTVTGSGVLQVQVPENETTDLALNGNIESVMETISFYDASTAPTPRFSESISGETFANYFGTDATSEEPIYFDVDFDRKMASSGDAAFTIDDITVTIDALPTSATLTMVNSDYTTGNYEFKLVGMTDGTIVFEIDAAEASDEVGNPNNGVTSDGILYDGTYPIPTFYIDDAESSTDVYWVDSKGKWITNDPDITVWIDFGEEVSDFDISDLNLYNATMTSTALVADVANQVWHFDIAATNAESSVYVEINSNVAYDVVGHDNAYQLSDPILYTLIGPTPVISSTESDPTPKPTITVTVDFDSPMGLSSQGYNVFTKDDIVITGGTIDAITSSDDDNGVYEFDVSFGSTIDGTIIQMYIDPNKAQDRFGNWNYASKVFTIEYQGTVPTPTIYAQLESSNGQTTTLFTADKPIKFTVELNAPLSGFGTGDVTVEGSVADYTVNAVKQTEYLYTFEISSVEQEMNVYIPSGAGTSVSGIDNAMSNVINIIYDETDPQPVFTGPAGPTSELPIAVTLDFNEEYGMADVPNTVASLLQASGIVDMGTLEETESGVYTFYLANLESEAFNTITIAGNTVQDWAGNYNSSATYQVYFDDEGPVPTITVQTTGTVATNGGTPINVVVDFGEAITGLEANEVIISAGTKTNWDDTNAGSGLFYFTISNDGSIDNAADYITIEIDANECSDDSYNSNAAASSVIWLDQVSPVFELTDPDYPTITTISDSDVDFVAYDMYDVNIAPDELQPVLLTFNVGVIGTKTVYVWSTSTSSSEGTIDLITDLGYTSPLVDGTVYTFNVYVEDKAGNSISQNYEITYDTSAPVPTVTYLSPAFLVSDDQRVNDNFNVMVDFGETVTDFDATDVVVTEGSVNASSFLSEGNGVYTFEIEVTTATPTIKTITVEVPGNTAVDLAGNSSSMDADGDSSLDVIFDNVPVTAILELKPASQHTGATIPQPYVVNSIPITFEVTFSEDVYNMDLGDIYVNHDIVGGKTGVLTPNTDGDYIYSFMVYNPVDPTAEKVQTGDIIKIEIEASSIWAELGDAAGNTFEGSNMLTVIFDNTGPEPTISCPIESTLATRYYHTNDPVDITVDFGEYVVGFSSSDIDLSSGTIINWDDSDAANGVYKFEVTDATSEENLEVSIAAGVAEDTSGNPSLEADVNPYDMIIYDVTGPEVVINATNGSPTNENPINVTITFSEPVGGSNGVDPFGPEVLINGASMTEPDQANWYLSFDPNDYASQQVLTFNVDPSSVEEGYFTVQLSDGVVIDYAGNANTASAVYTIVYDYVNPVPTISSIVSSPASTLDGGIPITVTFNEPVTGYTESEIKAGIYNEFGNYVGASWTITDFTQSTVASYSFILNPYYESGTLVFKVPAGVASDLAGNLSEAADDFTIIYDGGRPTPTLTILTAGVESGIDAAITNAKEIKIEVAFDEVVYDFTAADLASTVDNANIIDFVSDATGQFYTFTIEPFDVIVTVDVAENVCSDIAANGNEASVNDLYIKWEGDEPIPYFGSADEDVLGPYGLNEAYFTSIVTGGETLTLEVEFTERVVGFDINDITVNGGGAVTELASDATLDDEQYVYTFTYQLPAAGFSEGDVISFSIAEDKMTDLIGNDNEASYPRPFEITFATTAPAPTVTYNGKMYNASEQDFFSTNKYPFEIIVDFGSVEGGLTGFSPEDLSVTNGQASLIGGGTDTDAVFTFNILSTIDDGYITITLVDVDDEIMSKSGVAMQIDENNVLMVIRYDSSEPVPTISSTLVENNGTAINESIVPITVDFGETLLASSILDLSEITLNESVESISAIADKGNGVYTFTVTLKDLDEGVATIDILDDAVIDLAGNSSVAGDQFVINFDTKHPEPVISSTDVESGKLTNQTTIPVTVDFGETVTGFAMDDVTISGAGYSASSISGGTDGVYEFTLNITDLVEGNITIDIAALAATDEAGNASVAAQTFIINLDAVAPVPTITCLTAVESALTTNDFKIFFAVDFGEEVSGLEGDDIVLSSGDVIKFKNVDGTLYTFGVSLMNANEDLAVSVAAAVAADLAGNDNEASDPYPFVIYYDTEAPVPTISSATVAENGSTNATTVKMIVTFDEPYGISNVDPLEEGEISVLVNETPVSGLVSNWYSDTDTPGIFTFDIVLATDGSQDGQIAVSISKEACADKAGNSSVASETPINGNNGYYLFYYDATAPVATISSTTVAADNDGYTNESVIAVTVDFGEEMTGFDTDDFTVTGITASYVAGSLVSDDANGVYNFNIETSDVTDATAVTISVAAGDAMDVAGNYNDAGDDYTFTFDNVGPVAAITTAMSDPTNVSPVVVTIDFGEEVQNFTADDLTLSSGTATIVTDGGSSYVVEISGMTTEEYLTVDIAEGVCNDMAMNENSASTQFDIYYDNSNPVATIYALSDSYTNDNPIEIRVDFGEEVAMTNPDDIIKVAVGGTVTKGQLYPITYTAENGVYSFTISMSDPTEYSVITISVLDNAATDVTGNSSDVGEAFTIIYDEIEPEPTITSSIVDEDGITAGINGAVPVTIDFSETVVDFTITDVVLSSGSITSWTDNSDGSFAIEIEGMDQGLVTVTVAKDVTEDLAGNLNIAGSFTFYFDEDGTAPVPTVTMASAVKDNPMIVMVDFGEAVTGFTADATDGDIDIVDADGVSKSIVSFGNVSSGVYTFSVDVDGTGSITVSIYEAAAKDIAGQESSAASATFAFDNDKPVPTIIPSITNEGTFEITIDYGEVVEGFTQYEIKVSNVEGSTTIGDNIYSGDVFVDNGDGSYVIEVTPWEMFETEEGYITVTINDDVCVDLAGNTNSGVVHQIYVDLVAPTPVISSDQVESNGGVANDGDGTIDMVINFDETVTGFNSSDIVVTGAVVVGFGQALTNAGDLIAGQYVFAVDPTIGEDETSITITIDVPAGAATDEAGNASNAAETFTFSYYEGEFEPIITFAPADTDGDGVIGGTEYITVTVDFTAELVDGTFTASDIDVTESAQVSGITEISAGVYSFNVYNITDGEFTLSIDASVVESIYGLYNDAASKTIIFDSNAPTLTITSPEDDGTAGGETELTYTEGVDDYALAVIEWSIDGDNWYAAANVETLSDITEFANIAEGDVFTVYLQGYDAMGNYVIDSVTVTNDVTAPTLTVSSPNALEGVLEESSIIYSVSDDGSSVTVVGSLDGTNWAEITSGYDVGDLPNWDTYQEGDTVTLYVAAVDEAGNTTIVEVSIIIAPEEEPIVELEDESITNAADQSATATTNIEAGTIYLILEGQPQNTVADFEDAIADDDVYGASADITVEAGEDITISAEGLYPGYYYAYAVDALGRISERSEDYVLVIEGVKPVAAFSYVGTIGAVQFVNNTSNSEGATYTWDFGDGSAGSSDENPTYTYTNVGTYDVTLTVTKTVTIDGVSQIVTSSITIAVKILSNMIDTNAMVEMNVNVFPNPSNGVFTVSFESEAAIGDVVAKILDVNGRVIKIEQFAADGTAIEHDFDISMFNKGMYLIQLQTEQGIQTKRIVIQE